MATPSVQYQEYTDGGLFEISDEDLTFDLSSIAVFAPTSSAPYSPLSANTPAGVFEAPLIKRAAHETLETGIDLDLAWSIPAMGAPEAPLSAWNPYSSHYMYFGRDIYGEAREDRKASAVVRRASFSRRMGCETEAPRHPRILESPLERRGPLRCVLARMDTEHRYAGNHQFPGASAKKTMRSFTFTSTLAIAHGVKRSFNLKWLYVLRGDQRESLHLHLATIAPGTPPYCRTLVEDLETRKFVPSTHSHARSRGPRYNHGYRRRHRRGAFVRRPAGRAGSEVSA